MSTYKELKNRKSLLDGFMKYLKSHKGVICMVMVLACIPILYVAFNTMRLKPTVENYYKAI